MAQIWERNNRNGSWQRHAPEHPLQARAHQVIHTESALVDRAYWFILVFFVLTAVLLAMRIAMLGQ